MPDDLATFTHTEEQQKTLDFINERFEAMDACRSSTYDEGRQQAYEDYRGRVKNVKYANEQKLSTIHVPVGTYYNDSLFYEIFVELMSKRPLIPVEPGGNSADDVAEAKIVEAVLDYQLGAGPDLYNFVNLVLWLRETFICDCGVLKTDWEINQWYDGPRCHWWPLSEFWMDERAHHVCMARDKLFQVRYSKRELERRADNPRHGDIPGNWKQFAKLEPETDHVDQARRTAVAAGLDDKSATYKVWEYWADDGMIQEVGVSGRKGLCLLRERFNPNRFVFGGNTTSQIWTSPDLLSWGGIPMYRKMGDLTEWLDTVVRQSVDAFTLRNIPRFKNAAHNEVDEYALTRAAPGQVITMTDPEALQELYQGRDLTPQQQQWIALILSQCEESVGRYRGQRGAPRASGSDTATEFLALKGQSNLRVTAQEIMTQVFGFRSLGFILLGFDRQYMDTPVWVNIIDPEIGEMKVLAALKSTDPEQARMNFNIVPAAYLGTETKTIRTQQYMTALKILASTPVAPYIPWKPFLVELFRAMDFPAPQRFVKSEDDAMQMMMAMAAAQGGLGGGGGMKLGTGPGQGALAPAGAGSAETGMMQRRAMSGVPAIGMEGAG